MQTNDGSLDYVISGKNSGYVNAVADKQKDCPYRTLRQAPFHTNGGAWGTMYDDDIEYREEKRCLQRFDCAGNNPSECIRYHNLEIARLMNLLSKKE